MGRAVGAFLFKRKRPHAASAAVQSENRPSKDTPQNSIPGSDNLSLAGDGTRMSATPVLGTIETCLQTLKAHLPGLLNVENTCVSIRS